MAVKRNHCLDKLSKRQRLSIIYFCVMVSLGILQIIFAVAPLTLSSNMTNIVYTLCSQCICMGALPLTLTLILKPYKANENRLTAVFRDFRYKKPYNAKSWLLVIPLALSFYLFTSLTSRVWTVFLDIIGYKESIYTGQVYTSGWDLLLWTVMTAAMPAVFEEFTHRGLLLDMLEDRGNEWGMVLMSGLLFAGMHTNIVQFGYAFAGGCIMAYAVIKTGSIFISMILHFITNFLSVFISYSSQSEEILGRMYDAYAGLWNSYLGILAVVLVLIANLFLMYLLLGALQKVNRREDEMLRPKGFLSYRVALDTYRKDGKPTIFDNLFVWGALAIGVSVTLFTLIYGYFR